MSTDTKKNPKVPLTARQQDALSLKEEDKEDDSDEELNQN